MKLMIFFLIVVCLHVSAAGYGQKGTVTISGKDLPLEKVFNVIKKQTDYVCFYGYDVLKNARPVSLNFKDADVQEVLKAALWGQGLDFSITGKTITIMKRIVAAAGPGPSRTIKAVGVVYNEAGQPLSGANVTIKATGKGTITNAKGEFVLPAVPEESPLVISFIGYAPQVVKVSEGTAIQVYLNVAKNELDKVVVQAYGTTTQRLATGNIATVTAAEIEKQPIINPLQALEGKVPGLVVSQTSGYASAPFKVELRGRTVVDASFPSEPLYIIDGVPLTILENPNGGGNYNSGSTGFLQNGLGGPAGGQSPFFSISPNDIESITVLKDADATAIYGSRGANGVIIITTKKGKAGKTRFELNVNTGLSKVTRFYKMLNTSQYLSVRKEAFYNDSIAYGITPNAGNAPDLVQWDSNRYTDWQRNIWGGLGQTTNVDINFSGGDKQTSFRVGGTYLHSKSMLAYSGADQRATVQFNLSHRSLDQRLGISFTSSYSYSLSDLITVPNAVLLPPNAPQVFSSKGVLDWSDWLSYGGNPFSNLLIPYTSNTGFLNSRLTLSYELLKGLTLSTNLGYSTMHNAQTNKTPITSQNPLYSPTGSSTFGNNNMSTYIAEPQLEYKNAISKGKLIVLVGASIQGTSSAGNRLQGNGYINDLLLNSIANAPSKNATDASGQYKYAAVFGRINYNWDEKYLINLSARRDGSSRFGAGNQFGNFGAIGVAWIFTGENLFKDHISWLSFGKLRGSFGSTGSDLIGDYRYLTRWNSNGFSPYAGSPIYIPLQHANPDLHWQVNHQLEMALNLGFLKDRLDLEVVWYRNRCGNQLVTYPLPELTGFSLVEANSPASVQNTGMEATFNGKVIEKKDLSLSVNFNIGINRNKLLAFPNILQSPYAYTMYVGKPLNITQLLHYTGVDPQTGLYTFQDKDKSGDINIYAGPSNDLYIKDLSVKYDGGFGTDLQYKGFQFSLFFHFRNYEAPNAYSSLGRYPGQLGNMPVQVLDHWKKPGDKAHYARYSTMGDITDYYYYGISDQIYTNASFIRLQNVALSYDLPQKWVDKVRLQKFKIYVRGENLFVITKYSGIDPEATAFGQLPPSKIFTGGLQLSF